MMPELRIHMVQTECTIPHLMMKHNRNLIECCNNTHQGPPNTGKQMCIRHVTC